MNREDRRKYNKEHKTNYSKTDFEIMLGVNRLVNSGEIDLGEIARKHVYEHLDNENIAPEGCIVKFNKANILSRPKDILLNTFVEFVQQNMENEFHLTRSEAQNGLVCLAEDERYSEVDGERVKQPKFLFDLYSDLLIKTEDGEFKEPFLVDKDNVYVDALWCKPREEQKEEEK